MKLSDYKDEEALDLLAEMIEPAAEIFADKKFADVFKNNKPPVEAVRVAIKYHKDSVIKLLAAMEGVPVEEYHCNVFTLPIRLLEIVSDKDLLDFFSSQGQMVETNSSGSAMVNTEVKNK